MKKIGLFYATKAERTSWVAEKIQKEFGEDKILVLETQLYTNLVQALTEFIPQIQVNANQIARLDCLDVYKRQSNGCLFCISRTKYQHRVVSLMVFQFFHQADLSFLFYRFVSCLLYTSFAQSWPR